MVQADTVAGGVEVKAVEETLGLTALEREALVKAILNAEKIAALEQLIDQEVARIEGSGIDATEKQRMVAQLKGVKGSPNVSQVLMIIQDARAKLQQQEIAEVIEGAIAVSLRAQEDERWIWNELDETEMTRIRNRAKLVDVNRPETVRDVAEAFVDADVSKEIRAEVVADTERLLTSAPMKEAVVTYNAASEESRLVVNAKHEQAKKNLKKATEKAEKCPDPEVKKELQKASDIGAAAHPEMQKLLKDVADGKIEPEKAKEPAKKINDEWLTRVKKNIPDALAIVPEDVRKKANELGGPDQIAEAALQAFQKQKASPTRVPTEHEAAAQRVFFQARTAEIFRQLGNDAIALDISRGTTLEQRTERAVIALKKNDPSLEKLPPGLLEKITQATLVESEKRHIPLSKLDEIKGKELQDLSNQVFESVSGVAKRAVTAAMKAGKGIIAMGSGDEEGARTAATEFGRGAVRAARDVFGIEDSKAQAAGAAVADTLRTHGVAVAMIVTDVKQGASNAWDALANKAKSLRLASNLEDDLKSLKPADKQLVADIKSAMAKYGSKAEAALLASDKDGSGHLSRDEFLTLAASLKKLEPSNTQVANAPGTTPAAAKPQSPQTGRS